MRKSRLVILPAKRLDRIGFLLLFLACPVLADWGRIQTESESSHEVIQVAGEGTCGLQSGPPDGTFNLFQGKHSAQCPSDDSRIPENDDQQLVPESISVKPTPEAYARIGFDREDRRNGKETTGKKVPRRENLSGRRRSSSAGIRSSERIARTGEDSRSVRRRPAEEERRVSHEVKGRESEKTRARRGRAPAERPIRSATVEAQRKKENGRRNVADSTRRFPAEPRREEARRNGRRIERREIPKEAEVGAGRRLARAGRKMAGRLTPQTPRVFEMGAEGAEGNRIQRRRFDFVSFGEKERRKLNFVRSTRIHPEVGRSPDESAVETRNSTDEDFGVEEIFPGFFDRIGFDACYGTKIGEWTLNCIIGAVAYYVNSKQTKSV